MFPAGFAANCSAEPVPSHMRSSRLHACFPPARAPKTNPSSSELLASRFAPWTPVHADLARRIEALKGSVSIHIGLHPAHQIVSCRTHGNQIVRQAQAMLGKEIAKFQESALTRSMPVTWRMSR